MPEETDIPPVEQATEASESTPETVEEVAEVVEQVEDTVEALGNELLARLDAIDSRLAALENERTGSDANTNRGNTTEPDPLSEAELTPTEPDRRPNRDHFWFRKVNE